MSKASEWAFHAADLIARQAALSDKWDEKPQFRVGVDGAYSVAGQVTAQGRLLTASATLTPRQALEFARWILDTFGEQP